MLTGNALIETKPRNTTHGCVHMNIEHIHKNLGWCNEGTSLRNQERGGQKRPRVML